MYAKTVVLKNASGLHARPASEFVAEAKQFASKVFIRNLDKPDAVPANAKSIVRVLAEGIPVNTKLEITADGADEAAAVERLTALIESGLGEE
jgi:phosphocarrier protein